MALSDTIRRGIDQAFRAAGDLVVDVVLEQENATSYDFTTGQIKKERYDPILVQGILFTAERESQDGNRLADTLILRGRDVRDLDIYDKFRINGKTYRMESYQNHGGYAYEITVSGA